MGLLETLLGTGFAAGFAVSATVYLYCPHRGLGFRGRIVRALASGTGVLASFLLPYVFSRQLKYVYFQLVKPQPLATTPGEWRSVTVASGLVIATIFLVLALLKSSPANES
ncbi:hypothetical protein [Halorubellus salinus]|uniref:hypothetical protein n=1 Tax=Halorubellus salinus TaxID=755309 RepID=UPI001D08F984|nr:hypothetical protein [Halorubellus salinus]